METKVAFKEDTSTGVAKMVLAFNEIETHKKHHLIATCVAVKKLLAAG